MLESIDVEATVYVINNSGKAVPLQFTNPKVSVWWVDLPSNLGVASSWNLGIKMLPFESRWFFSSADVVYAAGDLDLLQTAKDDVLTLSEPFPHYQSFAVGQKVVEKVGLFDESLHPIYFEDNDYARRLEHFKVGIEILPLRLAHDNSSTINSDVVLSARNQVTFQTNARYLASKVSKNRFDEGRWDLTIRRMNTWD